MSAAANCSAPKQRLSVAFSGSYRRLARQRWLPVPTSGTNQMCFNFIFIQATRNVRKVIIIMMESNSLFNYVRNVIWPLKGPTRSLVDEQRFPPTVLPTLSWLKLLHPTKSLILKYHMCLLRDYTYAHFKFLNSVFVNETSALNFPLIYFINNLRTNDERPIRC